MSGILHRRHIGIVYASYRSRLSTADSASLFLEISDEERSSGRCSTDVEIITYRDDKEDSENHEIEASPDGPICIGTHVQDADINAILDDVVVGGGAEAVLTAPTHIVCKTLYFNVDRLIVEPAPNGDSSVVYLRCDYVESKNPSLRLIPRQGVEFSLSCESVTTYPWIEYRVESKNFEDPEINEVLQRFRKFVILFRSHKKGRLARYVEKFEHRRMTKGKGEDVLRQMLEEKIMYKEGRMYFLDPTRLGWQAGIHYDDCVKGNYNDKTLAFARRVLKRGR